MTDNDSNNNSMNLYAGTIVDNIPINKFETIYSIDFFEDNVSCKNYISNYDQFIQTFVQAISKQPFKAMLGDFRYRSYGLDDLIAYGTILFDAWLKDKYPILNLIKSFSKDIEIAPNQKYWIKQENIKESIKYFQKQIELETYIPPNKL